MFEGLQGYHSPLHTEAELATQALGEEAAARFPFFSANDAVALGLSLRKRFRASSRHARGRGMVLAVQTVQGHTLFSCTVGDLGDPAGASDVGLDAWAPLDAMIAVVRKTGHSSWYIEKGMNAMGKTAAQLGIKGDFRVEGGAFPVWLENALCCPIAVVACYSGSGSDDHRLVANAVRDYLKKIHHDAPPPPPVNPMPIPHHMRSQELMHDEGRRESSEWVTDAAASAL